MKKILSIFRTFFYFLSEIFEFTISLISSLSPNQDSDLSGGDIFIVTGYLSGPFFYSKLRKALESKGYKPRILNTPSFLFNTTSAVEILSKQMDQIPSKSVLLAHNTGGLITLLLPDRSRQKIRGLITLGTPFRGSYFLAINGLYFGSKYLKELFKTFLFMDRFHPLSPLKEFIFLPASSSVYGEGRDLWFDIPGNYNQVRKAENIRTILEFISFHYPSATFKELEKKSTSIPKLQPQSTKTPNVKKTSLKKQKSKNASKTNPSDKQENINSFSKRNSKTKSSVSKTKDIPKKKSSTIVNKKKNAKKKH
ncbi:esterase/lipase family protein [Leptospira kirschneri]|uniref:esterase/lipase family protein n=1 Tax=Leptospira kirschneri TaxID=29507 RepID=UPI0002784D7A|nr:hypothetical protein [Leptospira kirschneri]EJO67868.1 hypothetical protein LEP1GSC044_0422 [Leptospira kirschneri serovar Grippotyphosa str. RM52]EKQ85653.1 hypothetical protein LEP1GSC064_0548 [Leptospira kirschneri serovar Grippotyphosa str. Moskva]EKR09433.1 hypothetical protein LEP1GSC122_0156 [Leptospira kirschneri serovar Valbuzzi str. 200702274]EMK02212.1 hypothetical protein LEP1GSC176_1773 [Leptospira kirschneri str. MMD1493]OOV47864.1 hypothetical protein B1J94_14325 [Leptospira 